MRQPDPATLEALIVQSMRTDNWSVVAELEARLAVALQATQPVSLAAAALYYAEQGLRVFPLQPRSKLPYKGSQGFKDATTDLELITVWWELHPDSNIGIATGHLVDVIDIDGPDGAITWARTPDLPDVVGIVSTPRDSGAGIHLYIETLGERNGAKFLPGMDYRGLGGYVVAPPSVHPNGKTYRWRRPLNLNQTIPQLTGPIHDNNLCSQCGHPLDVQPHPHHYLAG